MTISHFRGLIKIHGINPYVLVSAKRAAELKPGWRKPIPVLVRINEKPDEPWRINMLPVGDGSFQIASRGHADDGKTLGIRFDDAESASSDGSG